MSFISFNRPSRIFARLSSPDIIVTNQKDKQDQLPKIKRMDDQVREAFAQDVAQKLNPEKRKLSCAPAPPAQSSSSPASKAKAIEEDEEDDLEALMDDIEAEEAP